MKTCVILNPWAGRGAAGQRRPDLEAALREQDVDFTLLTTHARGGATELTYQAIGQGYECVVAVGGDGTINEVVNGIIGNREAGGREAALAIVPLGTGSDFVKALNTIEPNDVWGAARRIAAGRLRSVDAGMVTVEAGAQTIRRAFVNGLGMGIDAQVAVESNNLPNLRGFAVYLVAVMRALATYKAHVMSVKFDDYEVRRRLLFASVANGQVQGGGFRMTPDAIIDDGLLDLCIVDKMRLDEIVRHFTRLIEGTHTTLRQVTMGRARHVEVSSNGPIPVATDGEVIATDARHVVVDVLPGAIQLVC
jgi:YegS/Rv2252/BmrU family lipid kinase